MQIIEIVVSAGRTFNHPHESYSNLRPEVTLKAVLGADEDPDAAAKQLQAKAERLVEDHKSALLQSLHEIEQMSQAERTIASLESQLTDLNGRLDRARKYMVERRGIEDQTNLEAPF